MKNTRALLMVGVSVLAGLLAIIFAARWVNEQTAIATRKVAVANVDLELGQQIKSEHVKLVDWPSGAVPSGAFSDADVVQDRVTRINLLRDEPILESKLAPIGMKGGLSAVIPEGKRAITVRVNDVIGVAGFALPGTYVDVIVSTKDETKEKGDQYISKIVLEKILVLAVAQEASRDETKPKVVNAVTLEVTPAQAESIDLARSIGQLSLVLRNQVDSKTAETRGVTKDVLLGFVKPPPPKPVRVAGAPVMKVAQVQQKSQFCALAIVGNERKLECF